jgi:hypothetical protein
MAEVPWHSTIPDAELYWYRDEPIGFLHFKSPEDGGQESVRVETGPGKNTGTGFGNVWHIEPIMYNRIATVSPSIHFIGHFHSPNPVQFHITKVTRT